jgi:hypothetical protein
MSFRWHRGVAFCLLVVTPFLLRMAAHAEYSQGIGEIQAGTAEASAKLNDGLSEFHEMAAALDRGQPGDAEQHRKLVVTRFQEAANAYESTRADGHVLNPLAKTDQEKQFIEYFMSHAGGYGIKLPTTQSQLILASSHLVREYGDRIASEDAAKLAQNTAEQQLLANQIADLQKFLISATTVLTLG